MTARLSIIRRALAAVLLGLAASACAAHGDVQRLPVAHAGLVQVEVYDRTSGATLDVHAKDGRRYIVGVPGHEYAVRVRNTTGARVLAVASVDGVNVISGDTASPSQSGYVLAVGLGRSRRLAQEPRAHCRLLLHRARELLRCAHRPAGERRRDRRRGLSREAAADRTSRSGDAPGAGCRRSAAAERGRIAWRGKGRRGTQRRRQPPREGCTARHRAWTRRGITGDDGQVRARERNAVRSGDAPLRPPRESRRDGRVAAERPASWRRAESVSCGARLYARSAAVRASCPSP
jgi:hypothetical protein